jgi:hypothetical protein
MGFKWMVATLVGCWAHIIQHSQTYHLKLRFVLAEEAKNPFLHERMIRHHKSLGPHKIIIEISRGGGGGLPLVAFQGL